MGRMNRTVFGMVLLAVMSEAMVMRVRWTNSNPLKIGVLPTCECFDFRSCDALQGTYVSGRECEVRARISMKYSRSELSVNGRMVGVRVDIPSIDSMYREHAELQSIRGVRIDYPSNPMSDKTVPEIVGRASSTLHPSLGQPLDVAWIDTRTIAGGSMYKLKEKEGYQTLVGMLPAGTLAMTYDSVGIDTVSSAPWLTDFETLEVVYILRYNMGGFKAGRRGMYDVSYPCNGVCAEYDGLKSCLGDLHDYADTQGTTCFVNHVHLYPVLKLEDTAGAFATTIAKSGMCIDNPKDKGDPFDAMDIMLIGPSQPAVTESPFRPFEYAYTFDIRDCGQVSLMKFDNAAPISGLNVIRVGRETLRVTHDDKSMFAKGSRFFFASDKCKFKPVAYVKHQTQTISKQ